MCFKEVKKEVKSTFSYKIKKKQVKKLAILRLNSDLYLTSLKYNSFKYFLRKHSINLNNNIVSKLLNEEVGFIFSLTN